jgi:hypothetical protein
MQQALDHKVETARWSRESRSETHAQTEAKPDPAWLAVPMVVFVGWVVVASWVVTVLACVGGALTLFGAYQ